MGRGDTGRGDVGGVTWVTMAVVWNVSCLEGKGREMMGRLREIKGGK